MPQKKQLVITTTIARPPFLCPTHLSHKLTSFSDMPAFSIIFPASTKNGIAKSINLDKLEYTCIANKSNGRPEIIMQTRLAAPREMAIGTFIRRSTINTKNNIAATDIYFTSFFFESIQYNIA